MKRVFTKIHRENISKACMGRAGVWKGKKMPKDSLYKNMATHIRFKVPLVWLKQFEDIEKLKFLNKAITPRDIRFKVDTRWYIKYVLKFYYDKQFIYIYSRWIESGKDKYMRPTVDHINPKANGGNEELDNLQFLTWFENRAKNDMPLVVWQEMKKNIKNYLI
jgi:hypothetical protein